MEYLVSDVVIFDGIRQLVSSIPGVEEPSRSARPVTRILYIRDHHSFVVNNVCPIQRAIYVRPFRFSHFLPIVCYVTLLLVAMSPM